MNSGKSLELLKTAYSLEQQNKTVLLFTSTLDTRNHSGYISCRIPGLNKPATPIGENNSFIYIIESFIKFLGNIDCILVDEVNFLNYSHILDLRDIVDEYKIPIICYGLKNDFQNNLFEGSKYLLIYADIIEEVKSFCQWCNRNATMILRIENNKPIYHGPQIKIGGNESYISVCAYHHKYPEILVNLNN